MHLSRKRLLINAVLHRNTLLHVDFCCSDTELDGGYCCSFHRYFEFELGVVLVVFSSCAHIMRLAKRPRSGPQLAVIPAFAAIALPTRIVSVMVHGGFITPWQPLVTQTSLNRASTRRINRHCSNNFCRRDFIVVSCVGEPAATEAKKREAGGKLSSEYDSTATTLAVAASEPESKKVARKRGARPGHKVSMETKRKIGEALLGRRKSDQMRQKLSERMKGRVPWNKGKTLSCETRLRMSEARMGYRPWNKGRTLSFSHRRAISLGGKHRSVSELSRSRMRMARRRPGDAIVSGGPPPETKNGTYPLVDTSDLHEYVSLRRELKVWSDRFSSHNSRRPSLTDVRRIAPPRIVGKFERYVGMRNRIRGLASDVYNSVHPESVPVVVPRDTASSPQNNNAGTVVKYTLNGNPRLVEAFQPLLKNQAIVTDDDLLADCSADPDEVDEDELHYGAECDPWDVYDRPRDQPRTSRFQGSEDLIASSEATYGLSANDDKDLASADKNSAFSVNDYRAIGRYRLVESIDLNKYMQLRRELLTWSEKFKELHGHVPSLSEVSRYGNTELYRKFCQYIEARDRVNGLVTEVCGTPIDDVEELRKVSEKGKNLVDRLHSSQAEPQATDFQPRI